MINNMETINQEVLSDNKLIFNRIKLEISNAKSEILIASAWFTDSEIFELLLEKAKTTNVSIIIGDNEDNNRIDFGELERVGGSYLKVKNVGFGIMHQKFCVIDRRIAIHGSYNYTNNARLNNHESVIVTNHLPTVNQLIETFSTIKEKSFSKMEYNNNEGDEIVSSNGNKAASKGTGKPAYQNDYEKILNTLIDAEINHFDRKELSEIGKKRSESCQGDFNVLPNELDTVFYNFLNDVHISAEQKVRLLSKISEQKVSHIQLLDIEHNGLLNRLEVEKENRIIALKKYIEERKAEIERIENKNDAIEKIDIKNLQGKNEELRDKINEEQLAFIKPKFRWYDFIPISLLGLILLVYLVLFYSSAAYILLFSKTDTIKAINAGAQIPPHQVFEPKAIQLAIAHGGSAILFIFFFVVIPIAFALAERYTSHKFWKNFISYFLGVLLIDGLLAYTVAKSIFELKVLTGEMSGEWKSEYAISDVNFYLVFVMGAAALLVFKFVFAKIMSMFEERNPDIQAQRSKLRISLYKDEIKKNDEQILEYRKQIVANDELRMVEQKNMITTELELSKLPNEHARSVENTQADYILKKEYFNNITAIYISRVENNQPKISIDALRDRINIFLGGWNDYLHGFYAYNLATVKSKNATTIATDWLDSKIENKSLV